MFHLDSPYGSNRERHHPGFFPAPGDFVADEVMSPSERQRGQARRSLAPHLYAALVGGDLRIYRPRKRQDVGRYDKYAMPGSCEAFVRTFRRDEGQARRNRSTAVQHAAELEAHPEHRLHEGRDLLAETWLRHTGGLSTMVNSRASGSGAPSLSSMTANPAPQPTCSRPTFARGKSRALMLQSRFAKPYVGPTEVITEVHRGRAAQFPAASSVLSLRHRLEPLMTISVHLLRRTCVFER
jgi:hypothetical protein